MLLSKLLRSVKPAHANDGVPVEYPLEVEAKLNAAHARAPVRRHLEILHGHLAIGGERYTDVYSRCLEETGTVVTPFNVFQRFQTRHDLVRYFMETLGVPGARVECGAYRGATALLLCRAWRAADPSFSGRGFHLLDSFTGTGTSTADDFIPVRESGKPARMQAFFPAGKSDVSVDMVRGFFGEFPEVAIHGGWVPEVFSQVADARFAFVHVDLTLYEATLAALEHFHPRLSPGGVILCDGSLFCPGVEKAVERYASTHDAPYVTLGHRQYVFMQPAEGAASPRP